MAHLQLSLEVHAPTSTVFDYVDRHENFVEFFKGFSNFECTCPRHRVGARLKMEGKSAWVSLPIEVEVTAVVPEREISSIFVSGLRGHWEWLFQPVSDATRVTVLIDYDLPSSLLGQANRSMLDRAIRSNIEKTLAALKERVEAAAPLVA